MKTVRICHGIEESAVEKPRLCMKAWNDPGSIKIFCTNFLFVSMMLQMLQLSKRVVEM